MSVVAFKQVDVFTSQAFKGNPVAVIMDASTLTSEQMQAIANWTNLSETTFVLPATDSQADYQVRIFTPQSELPFAGHPTIGTAYALLEAGIVTAKEGKLVQQCGAGLVTLTVSDSKHISFELPKPKITPLDAMHTEKLAEILNAKYIITATRHIIKGDRHETVLELATDSTNKPFYNTGPDPKFLGPF